MIVFRSLLLRLLLIYALVLSVSLGAVIAGYYYVSVQRVRHEIRERLRAEAAQFATDRLAMSPVDIKTGLERRARERSLRTPYHVLIDPKRGLVSANLPSWPAYRGDRWLLLEAHWDHNGNDSDHAVIVWDQRLPDGARLLLGRDAEDLRQREETLFGAARWLLVGAVLFGIVGGVIMSFVIGKRIELIDTAARRVMAGDLNERIPSRGRGDDFYRLSETLNAMLDRIQALLASLRRVSDGVAHELRTPLNRLHVDLCEAQACSAGPVQGLVRQARHETEGMIALFDAVLRIGRIESIAGELDRGYVDLSQLLVDVEEVFSLAAEDRLIRFIADIAPGLVVLGDKNLLFQAVGNALDNAVKFASFGGTVSLTASRAAGKARIVIEDDGVGIAADHREQVFERFVRLRDTAGVPGLGLGLSFVKAVADAHTARVAFEEVPAGARFVWEFDAVPTTGRAGHVVLPG